jgi:hypothetical protein
MPPPSCPRGPLQTKSIHLTLEDINSEQAHHAINALLKRPLFPDTSSWVQGPRPASNLGMRANMPAYPTAATGYKWVHAQVGHLERGGGRSEGGWSPDATQRQVRAPSVDWCMDSRYRGRRVLLRGLPGMVPDFRIRQAASAFGVEPSPKKGAETDDLKQLPA